MRVAGATAGGWRWYSTRSGGDAATQAATAAYAVLTQPLLCFISTALSSALREVNSALAQLASLPRSWHEQQKVMIVKGCAGALRVCFVRLKLCVLQGAAVQTHTGDRVDTMGCLLLPLLMQCSFLKGAVKEGNCSTESIEG